MTSKRHLYFCLQQKMRYNLGSILIACLLGNFLIWRANLPNRLRKNNGTKLIICYNKSMSDKKKSVERNLILILLHESSSWDHFWSSHKSSLITLQSIVSSHISQSGKIPLYEVWRKGCNQTIKNRLSFKSFKVLSRLFTSKGMRSALQIH